MPEPLFVLTQAKRISIRWSGHPLKNTRTMVSWQDGDRLTAQIKFADAVGCEGTPVSLVRGGPAVTNALWLPWLIQGLKVEHVDTPLQHTTHGVLVVSLCVGGACLCRSIVGTTYTMSAGHCCLRLSHMPSRTIGRPSGFPVGQLDVVASEALDVAESLLQVIEVCCGGIFDVLSLPVGKRVDEAEP